MRRVFVIGDIHGCVDELDAMLDTVEPGAGDTVCFLGDYVDRGPSPRGVIDRLLRLEKEGPNCVFLRGNHEDMFLAYMGRSGHHGDVFLENGGMPTLVDYGVANVPRSEVAQHIPPDHLGFLDRLVLYHSLPGALLVHAGLNPARSLEDQSVEDLLWIREDFTGKPHSFGVTVLFGHTPYRDVFIDVPYKLGLDTGVVYGNWLSCLELTEGRLVQVERESRRLRQRSLGSVERGAGTRLYRAGT